MSLSGGWGFIRVRSRLLPALALFLILMTLVLPMKIALLSSALTLLLSTSALANDWIVSSGGSIQTAVAAAVDGDRILVEAGTYNEVIDLLAKRLELIGIDGAAVTIIDGGGLGTTVIQAEGTPAGTRVEGFTLTHGAGRPFPSSYGSDYYGGAVWAGNGAQLELEDCVLVDNAWGTGTFAGGIYSGGARTHVTVRRCVIAHNRAWASGGATLCDGHGEMTLEQCTVYGNSSDNFFGHQGGVSMANSGQVWVTHSIVWGNDGDQIGAFAAPYNQGTAAYVDYSDVEGGFTGVGNLSGDPLFAGAGSYDFGLLPGSPCIDAGNPAFANDCDGSLADLGAVLPTCPGMGVQYCAANANSLGNGVGIYATGSMVIADNNLLLEVDGLPSHQLGYFIMSANTGWVNLFGGSEGVLCLGAPIIRLNNSNDGGQTLNSGASGSMSFAPNLVSLPQLTVFQPGAVWNFQLWYRDTNGSGTTSNTSGGLALTFL